MPLYYARDERLGYSPEWVQLCKRSMASVLPAFNSERVLRDYLREFYAPAARHGHALAADEFRVARELGAWKEKVRAAWPGVALKLLGSAKTEISFAERVTLEVEVALNGLAARDVRVECQVQASARLGARRARSGLCREPPAEARRRLPRRAGGVCWRRSGPVTSTGPATAAIGSSSSRRGPALSNTRSGACPIIRTCPIPYELGLMRRL